MDEKLLQMIVQVAEARGLQTALVYAVCRQESALNPLAVRFEPDYRWLWKPKEVKPRTCSLNTERALQKMSFGLMQVMGAVFREYGYQGWLTEIIARPDLQLDFGCKHLAKKIRKYGPDSGILAIIPDRQGRTRLGRTLTNIIWIM
jgi:hypothetical protein